MVNDRFFKITTGVILILLVLYLFSKVEYIFGPLKTLFVFLLIPILLSLLLYYLLRPLVDFLTTKMKYKNLAIFLSFFLLLLLIITISIFGGNIIQTQIKNLSKEFTNYYDSVRESLNNVIKDNEKLLTFIQNFQLEEKLRKFTESIFYGIRNNLMNFFSTVTNIGTMVILIPFILYYFLKDDKEIYNTFLALIPEDKQGNVKNLLVKIDQTLAKYIGGQLLIAIAIGILTYIGFLIIRLPNALILSFIIMITSFIPFIGAILGSIPALLIGLTINLLMVLKVLIVIIIAQQIEGNIIEPKIHGSRLSIHPLMVIIVVFSFITLFGIFGGLFAVPIYAVLKIILKDIYQKGILKK